jgi:uncharacterized protein YfaS (alpha-2-macroglobulin family)
MFSSPSCSCAGANESPRKVKTPEYRIGYANLKIAQPHEKLTVQVRPANRAARPADIVRLEAEVKDHSGNPAADAEVVLYAVDEGVLSLTGYETPDPLAFFNQPRGLGVATSLTLPTLLREDAPGVRLREQGLPRRRRKRRARVVERAAQKLRRDAILARDAAHGCGRPRTRRVQGAG